MFPVHDLSVQEPILIALIWIEVCLDQGLREFRILASAVRSPDNTRIAANTLAC